MRKPYSTSSVSSPKTIIAQTSPMRKASGNGISTNGRGSPLRNNTSVQLMALREKTEKLIPPGTTVAPKGCGRPTRNHNSPWRWVG